MNYFYEIGRVCPGPNAVVCRRQQCRENTNLDDSRVSYVRASQIVGEVKPNRKYALNKGVNKTHG